MSDCTDTRFEKMLHAYEIGILKGQDLEDFEDHLYECDHCFQKVEKLQEASLHLRHNPAAEVLVRRAAEELDREDSPDIPRKRFLTAVPVSIVAIAAVLLLILKPWHIEFSPTHEAIAMEDHIAILYFDNLSDPEDTDRLGEMMTTLLITDLAESDYVSVLSSQRLYDIVKQLGRDMSEPIDRDIATRVAETARAKWMLTGTIMRDKGTLIVSSQIADVTTGKVVESQMITGGEDERIFSLVDRLTTELKSDLGLPSEALSEPDPEVASVTTSSEDAYRHFLEGRRHYYQWDNNKAMASFRQAVEFDSSFAMAYFWMSAIRTFRYAGDRRSYSDSAMKYFDHLSGKEKLLVRCQKARVSGNYPEAVSLLKEVVEKYSDDKEHHYWLGHIYEKSLRQFDDAIASYNNAIELDSTYKAVFNRLAYTNQLAGDFEEAIRAVDRYIALSPDHPNPYDTKAELYAFEGHTTEAVRYFEEALEIDSMFISRLSMSHVLALSGEYEKARKSYLKVSETGSKGLRCRIRGALAIIEILQGKFDRGIQILNDGLTADRLEEITNGGMNWKLKLKSLVFSEIGEADSALALSAELAPTFHAVILARHGLIDDARSIATELARDTADMSVWEKADYWLMMGQIELAKGNTDSALSYHILAADADWYDTGPVFGTHIRLAEAYRRAGELGEAAEQYEKTLKRHEYTRLNNPVFAVKAYYLLGLTYEESGMFEKAIENYGKYLDIYRNADPGFFEVDDARERLSQLTALP